MWLLLVLPFALLLGALVVVRRWHRWEGRVEYRRDRDAYARLRRRWEQAEDRLDLGDRRDLTRLLRRLEHRIDLSGQALRSRRSKTALWRWLVDPAARLPYRLDTPFERDYLIELEVALERLEKGADGRPLADLELDSDLDLRPPLAPSPPEPEPEDRSEAGAEPSDSEFEATGETP